MSTPDKQKNTWSWYSNIKDASLTFVYAMLPSSPEHLVHVIPFSVLLFQPNLILHFFFYPPSLHSSCHFLDHFPLNACHWVYIACFRFVLKPFYREPCCLWWTKWKAALQLCRVYHVFARSLKSYQTIDRLPVPNNNDSVPPVDVLNLYVYYWWFCTRFEFWTMRVSLLLYLLNLQLSGIKYVHVIWTDKLQNSSPLYDTFVELSMLQNLVVSCYNL